MSTSDPASFRTSGSDALHFERPSILLSRSVRTAAMGAEASPPISARIFFTACCSYASYAASSSSSRKTACSEKQGAWAAWAEWRGEWVGDGGRKWTAFHMGIARAGRSKACGRTLPRRWTHLDRGLGLEVAALAVVLPQGRALVLVGGLHRLHNEPRALRFLARQRQASASGTRVRPVCVRARLCECARVHACECAVRGVRGNAPGCRSPSSR